MLARTGIGVDAVDLPEATRRGVVVVNTPEGPTVSTAEHTIALMMAVTKTLPAHQRRLREASGDYAGASVALELNGLTLGLMAYRRIARRVAHMARAIGMHVIAHDPYVVAPDEEVTMVGFDELLGRADVVSLHAPLLPETTYCIGADQFAAMRPGVAFVNCARGGLVDHDTLLAAVDSGHLFGAGLDVTDPEPLPPDHPLSPGERGRHPPHRLRHRRRQAAHGGHGRRAGGHGAAGRASATRREPRGVRVTFATTTLPTEPDAVAPDGSDVRVLLRLAGGSMAHFTLPSGATSRAVRHRTVEEIWYVVAGTGDMWRHTAAATPAHPPEPATWCRSPPARASPSRWGRRSSSAAPGRAISKRSP